MMKIISRALVFVGTLLVTTAVFAAEAPKPVLNPGDAAWMLTSTCAFNDYPRSCFILRRVSR